MGNRSLYTITGDVLALTGVICHVSAEGLDVLALVDLLLVGDYPKQQFVLWLDGCLGVEPRIGLSLAEGLCDTWGHHFG
jgi:hypothetical protein